MPNHDTSPDTAWESNFIAEMVRLREVRKMTQTDLAKRMRDAGLPFHQQTIQRIETGERPVRLNEAFLIARALGTTVDAMTWRDEHGVHEVRFYVDEFRRTAAEIATRIQDCLQLLRDEASEIVTQFTISAANCEKWGMPHPDVLTNWMAAWALRYLDVQAHLTRAFESSARAAGSAPTKVKDIETTWSTLLPGGVDEDTVMDWIRTLEIDHENLMDISSDELYAEIRSIAFEMERPMLADITATSLPELGPEQREYAEAYERALEKHKRAVRAVKEHSPDMSAAVRAREEAIREAWLALDALRRSGQVSD